MTLSAGTIVRMTRKYRKAGRWSGRRMGRIRHGRRHIREFGRCLGMVIGPVQWPDGTEGPWLNVRWSPSGLRYGYLPEDLEVVT